ncbi:MAG: AMP-binding protein [Acidimicrobiales bacterium]
MTPPPTPPAWTPHLPAGSAPDVVVGLGATSLTSRWLSRWAAEPARPVVFDDASGWVTGGEVAARSRLVAARLAGAGLDAGDRLLVSAGASVDLVVAYVAALRLGLVVVPVNTAYREREVAHVVADARPAGALVDDADRARWVRAASGERSVVVVGPAVDLPGATAGAELPGLDAAGAQDPALLLYTSGTTGSPKGALLRHGNLLASAEAVALAWRWTPEDRLVLALPLFHLHGLGVGLHGSFAVGASVVLRSGFDAADVAGAVAGHRASLFFGVPTMYARLAGAGHLEALAALRLCVSGSAPLAPELFDAVASGAGQRIVERYGMTETVMNVSNPYDGERRPGTVGFPLPGVEVRLAEATDEVLLRGPNVFDGYWERPDANAEAFVDGWFASGDVGSFDGDGYLRIVGRRKELIISGGYNVYPREVEDVLRSHPAVVDAAVVGVADPRWGEAVVAFVEGDGAGAQEVAAVLAHAAERLAPYKRPKRLHLVDALPRNALGKVVKAELTEP